MAVAFFRNCSTMRLKPWRLTVQQMDLHGSLCFVAGEHLPFLTPVVTEGRPEEWLNRIEDAMFATTKKHLYKVLEESKGGFWPCRGRSRCLVMDGLSFRAYCA